MILLLSQNSSANDKWNDYITKNPWQMPKYEFSEVKSQKTTSYNLPKFVKQIKSVNKRYNLDKRIKLGSEKAIYPIYFKQKMDLNYDTPLQLVSNLFRRNK